MFKIKKQLTALGVLGINQRNAEYTLRYNPRHLYPLVDDKLLEVDKVYIEAGDHEHLLGVDQSQYSNLMQNIPHGHISDPLARPSRESEMRNREWE